MKKLVSVVIPTHNRADLLPRAIDSVIKQTYKEIEIIIVSDGSTDHTSEVVDKYREKDSRIQLIEFSEPKGGNVARNSGIKACIGEYISFLDDDDEWYPQKIEKQLFEFNKSSKIGLVYTGVHTVYVHNNVAYNTNFTNKGNLKQKILLDNCIGTTSSVMIDRKVLVDCGIFDEKLPALQDYDYWIRICQKYEVGVVSEPMLNYYNYSGNKQISAVTQKYIDAFSYIEKKYNDLFSTLSIQQRKERERKKYIELSNKAIRNKDGKQGRKLIRKSFKYGVHIHSIAYYMVSFLPFSLVLYLRGLKRAH